MPIRIVGGILLAWAPTTKIRQALHLHAYLETLESRATALLFYYLELSTGWRSGK